MSLEEYEDFVYGAGFCDKEDAVSRWKEISKKQDKIANRLNEIKEIRIKSLDTDLTANVAGRKWINCDGKINFPDGEVFTGPVENSVNGKIRYTFPAIYMGQEVEDISLEFKDGKVVNASAKRGQDLLHQNTGNR